MKNDYNFVVIYCFGPSASWRIQSCYTFEEAQEILRIKEREIGEKGYAMVSDIPSMIDHHTRLMRHTLTTFE